MMPTGIINCTALDRVIFGSAAAEAVAEEAARRNAKRVFLVVSGTLNRETDEIDKVRAALGDRYAGYHDKIAPHSPRTDVLDAAAKARDLNADLIVTVGGGSATDAAKVMAIALRHNLTKPDDLEPYHWRVDKDGSIFKPEFEGGFIPQIAVPTTMSAGEFNALGGCTDTVKNYKEAYDHPELVPRAVIFDPSITLHTPEWLWISTGVRALDHALETIGSLKSNAYCDTLALGAIELINEGLPRVKADPTDLDARLKCQMGMWMSIVPLVAGIDMGASHAIGHVMGGSFNVPHGHTSCVMAPAVLRYNKTVNGERQKRIAKAFGRPGDEAADAADDFIRGLGMPRSLKEVGIERDKFQQLAEGAMHDFWTRTNPREITGPDQVMEILELAAE
jgi:maleylacetate reductase